MAPGEVGGGPDNSPAGPRARAGEPWLVISDHLVRGGDAVLGRWMLCFGLCFSVFEGGVCRGGDPSAAAVSVPADVPAHPVAAVLEPQPPPQPQPQPQPQPGPPPRPVLTSALVHSADTKAGAVADRPEGVGVGVREAVSRGGDPGAPGRNDALRDANMMFASTNLVVSEDEQRRAAARESEIAAFQRMLETGRRLRAAKLYEEAIPNYTAVLNGTAPDDMKRPALLELALIAQDQNNLPRTLQILTQYLTRWPQDPSAPEILLRQGLIYRELGIYQLAMSKFYATMTSALVVKDELFDYYKRLVLQAQAEIAETLAVQNQHAEAASAFARLLKEESPTLNRLRVHYRYVQSLAADGKHAEAIGQGQQFLTLYPDAAEQAEVRFLLASAFKKLNRKNEAMREIQKLLASQQSQAREHPEVLAYWQQRTGNELANQLYQEGDFVHAVDIYQSLLLLNPSMEWQFPLHYQIGLSFERLEQPAKASEAYGAIVSREKELGTNAPPSLKTTMDMARWRQSFLKWQERVTSVQRGLGSLVAPQAGMAGSVTNHL